MSIVVQLSNANPVIHHTPKGLIGPVDLRKDVEQLQPLVRRLEVDQRDDEDGRRILPPTIPRLVRKKMDQNY